MTMVLILGMDELVEYGISASIGEDAQAYVPSR